MQIVLEGINGSGELWLDIMKIICGNTSDKCMIDLGCHRAPYTPLLGFKHRRYIDIQDRPLDHQSEQDHFRKEDILEYMGKIDKCNATIIASDVIEHLTKEQGQLLYKRMWYKANELIIFTPLGPYMVDVEDNQNPDSHRSGWTPDDFPGCSCVVFPDFHPTLGVGAFFAFHSFIRDNEAIINEIKIKYDKNRTD